MTKQSKFLQITLTREKKLLELKEKEDTSPESLNKFQRYDYLNIYLSELNLLKAVTTYLMQPSSK